MKRYWLNFIIVFFFISCSVKPEPLVLGKDACYTCKMTLVDKKFGAEIVTKKGKIYKFDDMNCMVNFNNSGYEPTENIAYRLVVDYAHPAKLLDATQTFYSKSSLIKSPMGGHLAGFEKKEDLEKFNAKWHGVILTWGDVNVQFK